KRSTSRRTAFITPTTGTRRRDGTPPLAVTGAAQLADDAGRVPADHRFRRHRARDDRSRGDHCRAADVGDDHRRLADPGVLADVDAVEARQVGGGPAAVLVKGVQRTAAEDAAAAADQAPPSEPAR